MSSFLVAKNLSKKYFLDKQEYIALKNVSLEIRKGEFVALMGPSGSGKSTLLYNLSGMDIVSSGTVLFDKYNLTSLNEREISELRLNKMGFIFQQIHLLENLSLLDNIIFPAHLAKKHSHKVIRQRAVELANKMQIDHIINKNITQVSGGQLQRVAICRSLINYPDILFGDEPTGALNSKAASDIMEILINMNLSGMTILLATHDIKVASKAERIIYIFDGCIAAEKKLGKYLPGCDNTERENHISEWLKNLNF